MSDSSLTNSTAIEVHKRLVNLISEEAEIINGTTSPDILKRHTNIIKFLIELQCLTSKKLQTQ